LIQLPDLCLPDFGGPGYFSIDNRIVSPGDGFWESSSSSSTDFSNSLLIHLA
jgi:hypothetical protein